jgi:hypothetical protein
MKVVINKCHGGFGLSQQAMFDYAKRKGMKLFSWSEHGGFVTHYTTVPKEEWESLAKKSKAAANKAYFSDRDIERNDPDLVAVVRKMGKKANGRYADLKVTEIPDGIEWHVYEYDGMECIAENHETWG